MGSDLNSLQRASYLELLEQASGQEPVASCMELSVSAALRAAGPLEDLGADLLLEPVRARAGAPRGDALPVFVTWRLSSFGGPKGAERLVLSSVEEEALLAELPSLRPDGTFRVRGVERSVPVALVRNPGPVFGPLESMPSSLPVAHVIPFRGSWLTLTQVRPGEVVASLDRRLELPAEVLLAVAKALEAPRATGWEEVAGAALRGVLPLSRTEEALGRLRSLFDDAQYELSRLGRLRMNAEFGVAAEARTLTCSDLRALVAAVASSRGPLRHAYEDEIGWRGPRRVATVGERFAGAFYVFAARIRRELQQRLGLGGVRPLRPSSLLAQLIDRAALERSLEAVVTGESDEEDEDGDDA